MTDCGTCVSVALWGSDVLPLEERLPWDYVQKFGPVYSRHASMLPLSGMNSCFLNEGKSTELISNNLTLKQIN